MSASAGIVRVRLALGRRTGIGPGKAALLQGIAETGSITAAGRRLKMSYRRAWSLIAELNAMFDQPLVETATGGVRGGGARLTALGEEVLERYRRIVRATEKAGAADIAELTARLARREQGTP